MSSTGITIDMADLQRKLNELAKSLSDVSPILNELGEIGLSSIDLNFQTGGRHGSDNELGGGSEKWLPSKRAQRENGLTLVDNATLRGSVNYTTMGQETLVFTTNLRYSAIHQFGGSAGRGHSVNLVARPYMVLQNVDLEDMFEVVLTYYSHVIGGT